MTSALPRVKTLTAAALCGLMLIASPTPGGLNLATAGPDASALVSRADAAKRAFDACIARAGSSSKKRSTCEKALRSELEAIDRLAKELDASGQKAVRSRVDSVRSHASSRMAVTVAKEAEELSVDAPAPAAERAPASKRDVATRSGRVGSRGKMAPRKRSKRKSRARRPSPKPAMRPPAPRRDASDSSGAEGYKDHGVNTTKDPSKDRFSTFSIDVDTGSYTIARRKLNGGVIPPKASVRVEEFVNYFGYEYRQPKTGPFAVDLEAAPSPFSAEKDTYVMRVGVQGKRVSKSSKKPVHLTFLVDVSGSMNRHDKLGLAKDALKMLTNSLGPKDTVSLVTYAGSTRIVLEPTGMSERGKIVAALDDLRAGGSTAMASGLDLAYRMALQSYERGHVNRVIVMSDGDANVGASSHEAVLGQIKKYVDEGVTLSTIGFGMGNYKDTMMEQLANRGNVNYYYIDTIKEARKVFGDQINGTLQVIAKDVKIQVEFDPKKVSSYRLIGYENRMIADEDFRDDKVDAGEIGAGHTVTALYEVVTKGKPSGTLATVRIRHKKPSGYKAKESAFQMTEADVRRKLAESSKDLQFATAVAGFAEILRESPHAKHLSYALIEEVARASASPAQKDRMEFIELVAKARALAKR